MRQFFTYCFNRQGADELLERIGRPLRKIWGRRFGRVQQGDVIYVVTVRDGRLVLICRLTAADVDLRAGRIAAADGSPVALDCFVPDAVAERLRFVAGKAAVGLKFEAPGVLDRQTIRGVRQITAESAALLDRMLESAPAAPRQPQAPDMRALSVRQPWAEMILSGVKSVEVRSRPTNVRGRIWLYASPIRIEPVLESRLAERYQLQVESLPRGVLVGTVEVVDCLPLQRSDSSGAGFMVTRTDGLFGWRLADPHRATRLRKPRNRPQPMWFYPF